MSHESSSTERVDYRVQIVVSGCVFMKGQNHFLDDVMQMAGGALSAFSSLREQLKEETRALTRKIIDEAEFVRRDEFEAVKAMAVKAREENEALRQEIKALNKGKKKAVKKKREKKA